MSFEAAFGNGFMRWLIRAIAEGKSLYSSVAALLHPDHDMINLKQPIGIFDAGIGSYAIVERVRRAYPMQDIIYLADRASFPYGSKSREELLAAVNTTVDYLAQQGCAAIILASNAPSIMVLQSVCKTAPVPVAGIVPPIEEALRLSSSQKVAVLGVKSMIGSPEMAQCVAERASPGSEVLLINASPMVDLVENFMFLSDPARTQSEVSAFTRTLLDVHPEIDVMTLSSTHLPWLRPFFEQAAPAVAFLDPADSVLAAVREITSIGSGQTLCLATQTPDLPASALDEALKRLGFDKGLTIVEL